MTRRGPRSVVKTSPAELRAALDRLGPAAPKDLRAAVKLRLAHPGWTVSQCADLAVTRGLACTPGTYTMWLYRLWLLADEARDREVAHG